MTITLYNNDSVNFEVDKNLTELKTVTGNLKERTSIVDPTITIGHLPASISTIMNYCYIPEFHRYYFMGSPVSIKNGLWEINCHCDILSTVKNQLRNTTGVVSRQESKYNLYLNDGQFKTEQKTQIVTKTFPSGFSNFEYVLTLAGGKS